MKSNKKACDFLSKFKIFLLIPIVLVFSSLIVSVFLGFNLDYDFRKVTTFSIKFNSTVTATEYDVLSSETKSIIKQSDISTFRIERIGEGAQNGLLVKIPNDSGALTDEIEGLKTNLESNLLIDIADKIESTVVISTTDISHNQPQNINRMLLFSAICVVCILAFVFLYMFIRFNLIMGLSVVLSILMGIAILTSGIILFRIPLNNQFMLAYFVLILSVTLQSIYLANFVKSTFKLDSFSKSTNKDRAYFAISKSYKEILIFAGIVALATMIVGLFGNASLIFTTLSLVLALLISPFVSIVFNLSIWSSWYQKDKDLILRRRLEIEKKKLEKKTEDKIVV